MAENTDTEITEAETTDTGRASKAFEALKSQLLAERARAQEAQAKLDELAQTEAAKQAEAERKRLEEAGEYKAILAKLEAEREAIRAEAARENTALRLRYELTRAGMTNELAIDGAVSRYADGDLGEYVSELRTAHPDLFAAPGMAPAAAPAQGAHSAGAARANWDEVRAMETSPNRDDRIKARVLLADYHRAHGRYPY